MSFRINSAQEEKKKKKRFLKLRSLLAVIFRLLALIQPFLTCTHWKTGSWRKPWRRL